MKTKFTNGCRTPAVIADELRKYGRLMSIAVNGPRKYELYNFQGEAFEVISLNDEVVQVRRKDVEAVKVIMACKDIQFGVF